MESTSADVGTRLSIGGATDGAKEAKEESAALGANDCAEAQDADKAANRVVVRLIFMVIGGAKGWMTELCMPTIQIFVET